MEHSYNIHVGIRVSARDTVHLKYTNRGWVDKKKINKIK